MHDLIDRLVPDEPYPRVAVAMLAATAGVPAFLYGFFVVVLRWPVQMWLYWGDPAALLIFLLGGLGLYVAHGLLRDVAARARESEAAGIPASSADRDIREAPDRENRDPVTLLQERYAAGELTEGELDRRLERLLELDRVRESTDDREPEDALLE